MTLYQSILKWILVLSGCFLMTAFGATLLPVDWMASTHEWLGLGQYPDRPVTSYLARSTALLYGIHGVLMLYTGLTIRDHWRYVPIFGWLHVLTGCAVFLIDWFAPMPTYWLLLEGPPVALLGVAILFLARRAGRFNATE